MTFDHWCGFKGIQGDMRQTLYSAIIRKYGKVELGEDIWEHEFFLLKQEIQKIIDKP